MAEENERYILQSVDHALAILELFGSQEELGTADVAKQMAIGKSTAFRLLTTLEKRGFLLKTANARYRLGIKLVMLASVAGQRMEIVHSIHPYLERLTAASGETSHFVVLVDETEVMFVDKVIATSSIRMDSLVGLRRLAHMTATGKAILAFKSEAFVDSYASLVVFEQRTPHSLPDKQALLSSLAFSRAHLYACDDEESELGLTCFAAPIFDLNNEVLGAISISGPSERMNNRKTELVELVKQTAAQINTAMQ